MIHNIDQHSVPLSAASADYFEHSQKERDYGLLPAASLASPSKKSQLKTPPHSTRRISGLTAINRGADGGYPPSSTRYMSSKAVRTAKSDEENPDMANISMLSSGSDFADAYHTNANHRSLVSGLDHHHHGNGSLNIEQHGLLSPEFSSPNLYEHVSSQNSNIFHAADVNIRVISDSPILENTSDKENVPGRSDEPLEAPKFTKKRSNNGSNNGNSSNKKSRISKTPEDFVLPQPHEMPEIIFESSAKPPYSYASLIGMALLRSPERRLTLAEIYQWISDNFKYYKKGEVGWQNSIRHNLSLNKAFEKTEKSKEKKGHFWQIVSGYEHIYCNIKESKRSGATTSAAATAATKPANATAQDPPTTPKSAERDDRKVTTHAHHNFNNTETPKFSELRHGYGHGLEQGHGQAQGEIQGQALGQIPNSNINYTHNKALSYAQSRGHSRNPSNNLGSIPELNVHYSSFNPSLNASPINMHYDMSPDIGITLDSTSLDFTSSFSCRSNFELSPIRPVDSGPILVPITPNKSNQNIQLPSITKQLQTLQPLIPQSQPQLHSQPLPSQPHSSQVQNKLFTELQNQPPTNSLIPAKFKTPLKLTSTPLPNSNSSVARKLWASPSYLDDFYSSPGFFNKDNSSVFNFSKQQVQPTHFSLPSNVYGSPLSSSKRRLINKANSNITNGYSTNEIFGIDICTIHSNDDETDS
ncbi:hypothetical protein PICMEDRAFT_58694 [Pichia membranifaciens NRRL Y-2026]|uniref:Fork-head domain-containing protein n=1 Tax=Pichia membranifaciens NRRL Y-2026 TaxID=763406 RepID=A0A1E3NJP5_9ASCO|nr:hypothetical protein PICMEDRAFT_58694 [Pichia membranifaciens NRRL Y-2026]ODQ46365.1 hypothetical protein PICMEDRAFT_58694 [Pichia membranifaciens NRRL Y-2026]